MRCSGTVAGAGPGAGSDLTATSHCCRSGTTEQGGGEVPVATAPSRVGGGNAGRVSLSRPKGRKASPGCHGKGHRLCHSARLITHPPGAQSPRPAPAPPSAGASRPPGRALASVLPGPAGLRGTVPRGRGNAVRFLIPPGRAIAPSPLGWQRPSPLPPRKAGPCPAGGPKAPRPAPAPPPAAAGTSVSPGRAGLRGTVARGRGKRGSRFPFPPGEAKALSPLPWQRPSPLPPCRTTPCST